MKNNRDKKIIGMLMAFVLFVPLVANGAPKTATMSREVLMDKIRGGWAGQTFGCTYGGPTEFKYRA